MHEDPSRHHARAPACQPDAARGLHRRSCGARDRRDRDVQRFGGTGDHNGSAYEHHARGVSNHDVNHDVSTQLDRDRPTGGARHAGPRER
ncbi:hypothetical protein [Lolliginicoccus levis]|uniref:hypothetical protein n=1 Tax=Lolliginicoccus levis TaxID=2919542 RepID=UPI00241DB895|nr:hypothetical protein [Lolliginicoccus levis]